MNKAFYRKRFHDRCDLIIDSWLQGLMDDQTMQRMITERAQKLIDQLSESNK